MPSSSSTSEAHWPSDVGILALEVYFPSQYVEQSELETFDEASPGKYTIGLGQARMGFCSDLEDINSLCLTVVRNLIEKNGVSYEDVGRLEVGTETIIDKSKSVKTVLMQLFEESGNTSVDGIDTTNACYGGTAALFNAINWLESSAWDGRYAVVVAGDIAVYATGNARCTGGAGAVAMLLGPNAPLVFDRGVRSTHMQHVYDFYKPDMSSEYPVVDGKLSIQCYLGALDKCYARFRSKVKAILATEGTTEPFTLDSADAFIFHSPYCKLVQKSLARLLLNDFLTNSAPEGKYSGLEAYRDAKLEETFFDKEVEKAFMGASKSIFQAKTEPTLLLANQVGNMYTPSVYGGLASYITSRSLRDLAGTRAVLFSYGSGLASSMFSIKVTGDHSPNSPLAKLHRSLADLKARLESRVKIAPAVFDGTMKLRQETHHLAPYTPVGSVRALFPGTWYVNHIDDKHRRKYQLKPHSGDPEEESPTIPESKKSLSNVPPIGSTAVLS